MAHIEDRYYVERTDPATGEKRRVRTTYKGPSRYKVRYVDPAGAERSQAFKRKVDAEKFMATTQADITRGEWIDPRRRRAKFDDWSEAWWATTSRLKPATVKGYRTARKRVDKTFSGRPIGSVDRAEVKRFVADMTAEGLSAKTVANTVLVLRLILAEAVEDGAIRDNPAAGVKLPRARGRAPAFLTAEQVAALVDATREEYRFLVLLLAYTGLRSSEACGLRVRHLDMLRGRIEVSETLMLVEGKYAFGATKTYATRTVPMPAFLRDEAAAYLAGRGPLSPDDLVFPPISGGGGRQAQYLLSESVRRYVLKPALARAGLPATVRVHDLRHTCASLLIQLGAHPRAIMERLGHSDITVTLNVYGHLFPSLEEHLTGQLDELYRRAETTPWKAPTGAVVGLPSGT